MVSAKVKPEVDVDTVDEGDDALFEENCCCTCFIRMFCLLLVFAWISIFTAAISLPYMFRAFQGLTDDERMWISVASGGAFAAVTIGCCCACCCCCCLCQDLDKDDAAASKASMRRSSVVMKSAKRLSEL